ncbi:MAG: MFS transporter [Planctomycetales bacterium]|nr:MFS transporter [Planctomycetales bacterium]
MPSEPAALPSDTPRTARRNFAKLVAFQVLLRVGWILKTESVVMPAVLDSIGAGAWTRALLPSLNRLGQTLPPLLYARRLETARFKKWSLVTWTILMGLSFWLLAAVWPWREGADAESWFIAVFLVGYSLFFTATGINQVSFSTLQGKLVEPYRRGKLMSVANGIGVVLAVACAASVMPYYLTRSATNFDRLFVVTGAMFILCGLVATRLHEMPSASVSARRRRLGERVSRSWTIFRADQRMRWLMLVAWASGTSLILFPHYQPLGRVRLGLGFEHLVVWVIVQNIGAACFSAPFGWLADRYGNRFVLRWATGLMVIAPLIAWGASHGGELGVWVYPSVFFFLGLTPVFIKVLSNYVLELVHEQEHPAYLATLGLALGLPTIVLSPLAGLAIDAWGFDGVFLAGIGMMLLGFAATSRLVEPRSLPFPSSPDEQHS